MNEENAINAQQDLVEAALELVFQIYDDAIEEKMTTPVVLVVDCEDELGGQIARGWMGDEAVEEAILMHHSESENEEEDIPPGPVAFARAFPWEACQEELSTAFPYLAKVFQAAPPEDGILVVGVTAGGASALTAPFSAR